MREQRRRTHKSESVEPFSAEFSTTCKTCFARMSRGSSVEWELKSCFFASSSLKGSSVVPDGRKASGSGSEVEEEEEEIDSI